MWIQWPKLCFQERHPGDSKNYNECIRHETIRVAVCDMLEGKCPCPEPLRYGREAWREPKTVGVGSRINFSGIPGILRVASEESKSLTLPAPAESWLHLRGTQGLSTDKGRVTGDNGCILTLVLGNKCALSYGGGKTPSEGGEHSCWGSTCSLSSAAVMLWFISPCVLPRCTLAVAWDTLCGCPC